MNCFVKLLKAVNPNYSIAISLLRFDTSLKVPDHQ